MVRLKPLSEQVVVILGASSGIGRETALQCAARGAKVVAAARSEPGLISLVEEIRTAGGRAAWVTCDASDFGQVVAVSDAAIEAFGRIDTWVNVAAVGAYAKIEDISLDDFRRVMDVNLMGYVHGTKAALPHLRWQGGALIFVSSIESTVAMPLQGAYATSKHAIQGFVETLRRELRADGAPISVTSVKPAVINTPFYNNARNALGFRPTVPPPAYHPAVVAECICHAAERPVRDLYAGGSARLMTLAQLYVPGMIDAVLERIGFAAQHTDVPSGDDALYEPRLDDNRVEGEITHHAFRFSPYTWLQTHPKAKAVAALTGAALVGGTLSRRKPDS